MGGSKAANTFLYFAYGSNLLTHRIHISNPSAVFKSIAKLDNYKLDFNYNSKNWGGCVANICKSPGSHVWGCLWELNNEHADSLDAQESKYNKINVSVMSNETEEIIEAISYQLKPENLTCLSGENLPSPIYKKVIVTGAIEHQLPDDYIKTLESIQDNGYKGSVGIKLPESLMNN